MAGKERRKKNIPTGYAHIKSTFNNTIVTFTDQKGNVVSWASAGSCGFKGSKKRYTICSQIAAQKAAKQAQDHG